MFLLCSKTVPGICSLSHGIHDSHRATTAPDLRKQQPPLFFGEMVGSLGAFGEYKKMMTVGRVYSVITVRLMECFLSELWWTARITVDVLCGLIIWFTVSVAPWTRGTQASLEEREAIKPLNLPRSLWLPPSIWPTAKLLHHQDQCAEAFSLSLKAESHIRSSASDYCEIGNSAKGAFSLKLILFSPFLFK